MRIYPGLLILWTLIICWATLSPSEKLPDAGFFQFPFFDKVAHFGLFTVFSFLLSGMIFVYKVFNSRVYKRIILVICTTLIFSIFIELMQKLVPGRDFEYLDITANLLGSMAGFLLFDLKLKIFSDLK